MSSAVALPPSEPLRVPESIAGMASQTLTAQIESTIEEEVNHAHGSR